jgi:hypothetical protein
MAPTGRRPVLAVILDVSQDAQDIHLVTHIKHPCDEPELVSPNIEHGAVSDQVGSGERGPKIGEVTPLGRNRLREPRSQRYVSAWVIDPKLSQPLARNDPHAASPSALPACSRIANLSSRRWQCAGRW